MGQQLLANRSLRREAAWRGLALANFLNSPADSIESFRAREIFRLCRELLPLDPASAPAQNLRRAANAHLQEFTASPVLEPRGWGWRPAHPSTAASEGEAIGALSNIAAMFADGTLDRMRQCELCAAWFFAVSSKMTVCGGRCRAQKFKQRHGEDFDQKRAEYMRAWRQTRKKRKRR